jgi:hypothetical protein
MEHLKENRSDRRREYLDAGASAMQEYEIEA